MNDPIIDAEVIESLQHVIDDLHTALTHLECDNHIRVGFVLGKLVRLFEENIENIQSEYDCEEDDEQVEDSKECCK